MALIFAKEPIRQCWDEVVALARLHWGETEAYRHGQPFNPDRERYWYYNDIGYHHQYTVRDGGRMVGHGGIYVSQSMHSQLPVAQEDTWFLLPEYRKGRNALNFYKFIEADLRKLGVVEIIVSAKLSNSAGKIIEYLGYTHTEKLYSKQLTENVHVPVHPIATAAA